MDTRVTTNILHSSSIPGRLLWLLLNHHFCFLLRSFWSGLCGQQQILQPFLENGPNAAVIDNAQNIRTAAPNRQNGSWSRCPTGWWCYICSVGDANVMCPVVVRSSSTVLGGHMRQQYRMSVHKKVEKNLSSRTQQDSLNDVTTAEVDRM